MLLYEKTMLFEVPDYDERRDGWTIDCGNKMDYDPVIVRLSSRVYPDGSYCCSVYLGGDDEIANTGSLRAPSQVAAMRTVENWSAEQADKIINAVRGAYLPERPLK